jgi:hypothetical protein
MTKELPSRPSLDHLKNQARTLQRAHAAGDASALQRVAAHLPGHHGRLALAMAQTVIAREYGVDSWPQLKALVEEELLRQHRAEASRAVGVPPEVLQQALGAVAALDSGALAKLLRQHPALISVQVRREPGSNLLHEACQVDAAAIGRSPGDVIRIIDLLVEAGIDINAPVALHEGGHLSGAWFCLRRGGSLEVLRHVLAKGAVPSGIYSAVWGRPEAIPLLHQHGADLEELSFDETPLLHAVKNRKRESTRVLLARGVDPNHADSQGATPLHYAVRQFDDADVIALLLAHGASPAVRSKRGLSPLDLAVRMGRQDIVEQLGGQAAVAAALAEPRSDDVKILPFLDVEGSMLEETVAFYKDLGFVCESLLLDHSFAKVSLGDAKFLAGGDGETPVAGDAVIYRCPPGVAPRGRGRLVDCCGLELIFVPDDTAARVASEPRLTVSDLPQALAFYENAGFHEAGSGEHGLALQLGSARIHLRVDATQPRGPRALSLWISCDDFDATYRRVRSRIPVAPPQVAFHGSIFFSAVDPDGHTLTFAAPVTDV